MRGSCVSNLEMDTARTDRSPRRARAGWAWLAGGDGFVLATVPSEVSFLNGLGMWVAGMALVSGFAMTVAASQWWSTSIASVAWVLPLWAVLYCLIERLVLKSFGTSWTWNLVITIPRLVLSLAIALVVGLPMSQVIYSGSINDQLSKTTTARIHQATNEITHLYDAKIAAAQKEIAAVQSKRGEPPAAGDEQLVPLAVRSRYAELLADAQDRLRPVLQARRAPGGRRRGGAEERAARSSRRRSQPTSARSRSGRQPRRRRWRTGSRRSRPTATSSPARRRSTRSSMRIRP